MNNNTDNNMNTINNMNTVSDTVMNKDSIIDNNSNKNTPTNSASDIEIRELQTRISNLSQQVSSLVVFQAETNVILSKILRTNKWSLLFTIILWSAAIIATLGFYYYAESFFNIFGIDISFIKNLYNQLKTLPL